MPTLAAILIVIVMVAVILAQLTARRPDDHGLIYEYQRKRTRRATRNGQQ